MEIGIHQNRNSVPVHLMIFISSLLCLNNAFSQNNPTQESKLTKELSRISGIAEQNLIYIQTNKGIYEKGEDIWFKVYELDSKYLEPSSLSEVLFVQLISVENNKVFWQEKFPITNGFSQGSIPTSDSLEVGKYYISATSKHTIQNLSEGFSGLRKIELIDNIRSFYNASHKVNTKKEFDTFKLFPEGGYLVYNLPCQVAFESLHSKGQPLESSGTLYENDRKLISIHTSHLGIGSFTFTPKLGFNYHISHTSSTGEKQFPIKGILKEGAVLSLVDVQDDNATFRIYKSAELENQNVYLRIQQKGTVYGIATLKPGKIAKATMPLQSIPRGIVECTIFNERLEPLAERLIYVNDQKKIKIDLKLSSPEKKEFYSEREKITLRLIAKDSFNNPIEGNFAISVFEKLYENSDDAKNMESHFFLSTQLKGQLKNPDYYFDDKNKNRLKELNLLLLTKGWRKYTWNEEHIKNFKSDSSLVLVNGILGEAKAKKKKNKSEFPVLINFIPGKNDFSEVIEINELGTFTIPSSSLQTLERPFAYFKYFSNDDSKFNFSFKDPFVIIDNVKNSTSLAYPIRTESFTKASDLSIRSEINIIRLNEVIVKAKSKTIQRDSYLSKLDSIAKFEYTTDYVCKDNILNCPIHVLDKKNTKPVENGRYLELLVWDGEKFVPGSDLSQGFINPPLPPYHYPKMDDNFLLETYNIFRIKGYAAEREFYEPMHDDYIDPNSDHRNTLAWKPTIITNKNGAAEISFYCSDLNSTFVCQIEGVSYSGLIGSGKIQFIVNK